MERNETRKAIAKDGLVYGPVHSRRLGLSLGLNICPTARKQCSFDCIYCECGSRPPLLTVTAAEAWPAPLQVEEALAQALRRVQAVDCITFAGNGEPTLHPAFAEIVTRVRRLRDAQAPGLKLVLLSNASGLRQEGVRAALPLIDLPILKLDAGTEETFQQINRPAAPLSLADILDCLKTLSHYFLQSLFVAGRYSNIDEQSVSAWIDRVGELAPQGVQIYSLDRTAPVRGLAPVALETLQSIADRLRARIDIPVSVFASSVQKMKIGNK
ncbi:MAG TPA: radical SAM protein [bacterium]|nr:radical SAM protein [bacterium]